MPKLDKEGLKEKRRLFKGFRPRNRSEASIINAAAQVIADHKKRRKK